MACFVVAGVSENPGEVAWDMEASGYEWGLPVAGLSSQVQGILDEMDAITVWVGANLDADPVVLAELWGMSLVLEERLRKVRVEEG